MAVPVPEIMDIFLLCSVRFSSFHHLYTKSSRQNRIVLRLKICLLNSSNQHLSPSTSSPSVVPLLVHPSRLHLVFAEGWTYPFQNITCHLPQVHWKPVPFPPRFPFYADRWTIVSNWSRSMWFSPMWIRNVSVPGLRVSLYGYTGRPVLMLQLLDLISGCI
jgi:hypothetical protein